MEDQFKHWTTFHYHSVFTTFYKYVFLFICCSLFTVNKCVSLEPFWLAKCHFVGSLDNLTQWTPQQQLFTHNNDTNNKGNKIGKIILIIPLFCLAFSRLQFTFFCYYLVTPIDDLKSFFNQSLLPSLILLLLPLSLLLIHIICDHYRYLENDDWSSKTATIST